jgi:hypothetical protein
MYDRFGDDWWNLILGADPECPCDAENPFYAVGAHYIYGDLTLTQGDEPWITGRGMQIVIYAG